MLELAAITLAAAVSAPVRTTDVPFQLVDNRIVVQTRINGDGPFFLIVDTGSSGETLMPDAARRLRLATKFAGYIGGAGSGKTAISTAKIASLQIGRLTFRRVPTGVVDMSVIKQNIGFPKLDGIIGYDILQDFRMRVDVDRSVLTLTKDALPLPRAARSISFTLANSEIFVPIAIDGVEGSVLLDTGDRSSLTLFKQFATANGFYDSAQVRNALTGFGIGGPVFSDVFRTHVSIFGAEVPNVVTRASRDRGGFFATSTQAGSIGTGLLKRFNIIYDYPNRHLIVWPSHSFASLERYDPAGMWLSQNAGDVAVRVVTNNGPAQSAGVRAGDRIVSVNGNAVDKWTVPEVREWFAAQPDGTRVSIVARDTSGNVATRTVILHDPTLVANASPATLPRHAIFGASLVNRQGGAGVARVIPGSPAAAAGLQTGDVIKRIAGASITDTASFISEVRRLRAGKSVAVDILRGATPMTLHAVLAAAPSEHDPDVTTIYGAITVQNTLRRTLVTLPKGAASKLPAVLFIGGIGCYSVDVATNPQDPYLRFSHDLSRAGVVTMRVEKSGVGDSQGPPCRNVDFTSESESYAIALDALKRDPHVDPNRVYLFGHSIGSVIAPRLALQNRVAGIIVAEAVGRDWPEYELRNLRRQLELGGSPPAEVDQSLIEKAACMQRLLVEKEPEAQIERSMPSCKAPNSVYPVTAAYVQQVVPLNIIQPWTQLALPVLAIYGASDFVTEEADHRRIVDVVNGAHPGTAILKIIDGMDHYLGTVATQKASLDNAQNATPEPYDAELSRTVVAWLCGSQATKNAAGDASNRCLQLELQK